VVAAATTQGWHLSPNGKYVAFTRQISKYLPKANELLPFGLPGISTITLAALDGTPVSLRGDVSQDVLRESLRWSPDGNELAFFGYTGRDKPPLLYLVNLTAGVVASRAFPDLDVAPISEFAAGAQWRGKPPSLPAPGQTALSRNRRHPPSSRQWRIQSCARR